MHNFSSCRCAVQHSGPDFYRKRKLPRLIRKRRKYRCVPVDCGCIGDCGYDRRRMLCFCEYRAWQRGGRKSKTQRWKFYRSDNIRQPCSYGGVSDFRGRHHIRVRRYGKRGNIPPFAGVFLLYYFRHTVLYVWSGNESCNKSGRKSRFCDGVNTCRSCNKHNLRPRIYIRI